MSMPDGRCTRLTEKGGFTLLELLVVIAVIAIVLALLMAGFTKAMTFAKEAQNIANLKTIGAASLTYAADHNGELPRDGVNRGEWATIAYGITPTSGTPRHLYSKSVPFGMADPPYVSSVDCFYSPFATAFQPRRKNELFMPDSSYALIGYLNYSLPRAWFPRVGAPTELAPGIYNDSVRESINAPLYSDFCAAGKVAGGFTGDKCAVVYLGGHVRVFSQKELENKGWRELIEYFTQH